MAAKMPKHVVTDPNKPPTDEELEEREERLEQQRRQEARIESATLARMRDALKERLRTQQAQEAAQRQPVGNLAPTLEAAIHAGAEYLVSLVADNALDEDECTHVARVYDRMAPAWRKAVRTYAWPPLSANERALLEAWITRQFNLLAESLVDEQVAVRRAEETRARTLCAEWVKGTKPQGPDEVTGTYPGEMTPEAYAVLVGPDERPDTQQYLPGPTPAELLAEREAEDTTPDWRVAYPWRKE